MSRWPELTIGEVAQPVDRSEQPVPGVTYRQIGVRLWGEGAYERESIDGAETKYKTLNRVAAGDIIVNKIWARNGSISVVSEDLDGCYCSGEFPLFRPDTAKLDPRWFFWITKTRWFWDRCDQQSRGTSGKNRLRPQKFLEIAIPLPPLEEQRRVVREIGQLATLQKRASRSCDKAASYSEHLMSTLRARLFNEVRSQVWQCRLGDVCEILIGATPSRRDASCWGPGAPWVAISDLNDGVVSVTRETITDFGVRTSSVKPVPAGTLLMSFKLTIGKMAIAGVPLYTNEAIAALAPREGVQMETGYLREAILASDLLASTKDAIKGRTLNKSSLSRLPVPLAPVQVQRRIAAALQEDRELVKRIDSIRTRAKETIDALEGAALRRLLVE